MEGDLLFEELFGGHQDDLRALWRMPKKARYVEVTRGEKKIVRAFAGQNGNSRLLYESPPISVSPAEVVQELSREGRTIKFL